MSIPAIALAMECNKSAPPSPLAVPDSGSVVASPARSASATAPEGSAGFVVVALPGATGSAGVDLLAFDAPGSRVLIPVPLTGSLDLLDTKTNTIAQVTGLKTMEKQLDGRKRLAGPNGAAAGDGFLYVGNRATDAVCAISTSDLKVATCAPIAATPDGLAYVATTKEIWVTTPEAGGLTIVDVSVPAKPVKKSSMTTGGSSEGYAMDEKGGRFFTNLEDKGSTLVIDATTHDVLSTWSAGCNADGPRGVAFDRVHNFLLVACTDHVQALDAAHDGAKLGTLETGAGVDNIDFVDGLVYAAAGKAAQLTIARLDEKGNFASVRTYPTSPGARNAIADGKGNAYVSDSHQSRILAFSHLDLP